MKLIPLRHRDKRYKRLHGRTERYHQHKVVLAFAEHYEPKNTNEKPTSEEKLFLHKRKAKAEAKRLLKNIK